MDVNSRGGRIAEVRTPGIPQFLEREIETQSEIGYKSKPKRKTFKHINEDFLRGTDAHQRRRAHKCSPYSLAHCPQVNLLQALRTRVHKRRSKGRVVGLDHQVGPGARGALGPISQLEGRDGITDAQSVVRIQGDRRDIKILIPEAGSVECLRSKRNR